MALNVIHANISLVRIQFCRLLKGLWWDENIVEEAHRDCETESRQRVIYHCDCAKCGQRRH